MGCNAMNWLKIVAGYIVLIFFSVWLWERLPVRVYGKRIAGEVVDAATGKPLANVYVSFLWEAGIVPRGFTAHNSRDICYHAAAAITDDAGRFGIEPWVKWTTYSVAPTMPIVLVYAPGYVPEHDVLQPRPNGTPSVRLHLRYRLWPFTGSVDQRMEMLFGGLANRGCHYGGESQKALFPMLYAIYNEAHAAAQTAEQQATVDAIATQAAYAAVVVDMTGPTQRDRLDAFVREHLK